MKKATESGSTLRASEGKFKRLMHTRNLAGSQVCLPYLYSPPNELGPKTSRAPIRLMHTKSVKPKEKPLKESVQALGRAIENSKVDAAVLKNSLARVHQTVEQVIEHFADQSSRKLYLHMLGNEFKSTWPARKTGKSIESRKIPEALGAVKGRVTRLLTR